MRQRGRRPQHRAPSGPAAGLPGIGRPSEALLPPIASARAKTPPVAISTLEVTSQHCPPQRFVGVLIKYRIESSDSMRTHEEVVGSSQWPLGVTTSLQCIDFDPAELVCRPVES